MKINCCSCNAVLFVRKCTCGKCYILTTAHTEVRRRDHTAQPIDETQEAAVAGKLCDACKAKEEGEKAFAIMNLAMRQKTCPKCHTETLSYYDL
jgi:hypothetical protein